MKAIIQRDIKLALRSGGHWILGLVFFVLFLALCAIALGGKLSVLENFAIPLTWLAFIFAALLSLSQVFRVDMEDGSLAQFKLSQLSFLKLCLAKLLSFGLLTLLPLIIITPIVALLFGTSPATTTGLILSLVIGMPAVAAYIGLSGALLCGRQRDSFLGILISAPLLVPTLIFGVAAATSFESSGFAAAEWRILLGLSLIALAIGLPAIIAAISANLE